MDIIKLDPEKQSEYSIKRVNNHVCSHKFIEIDVQEREIRCQKCNTVVDAFDFIYRLATETENHVSYKKRLEYEVLDLENRKIQLEKDLNYWRSKIRKEKG
jgi:predicted solute-binding protein